MQGLTGLAVPPEERGGGGRGPAGEAYTQLRVAEARIRQAEHRAERKEADRRLVLADRNRLRAALVEAGQAGGSFLLDPPGGGGWWSGMEASGTPWGQEIPRLKQQVLDLARKVDLRDAPRVGQGPPGLPGGAAGFDVRGRPVWVTRKMK